MSPIPLPSDAALRLPPPLQERTKADAFVCRDQMNPNTYVGGDPVNLVDPLGLQASDEEEVEIVVIGHKPEVADSGSGGGGGFGNVGTFSPPPPVPFAEIVVTGKRLKKRRDSTSSLVIAPYESSAHHSYLHLASNSFDERRNQQKRTTKFVVL